VNWYIPALFDVDETHAHFVIGEARFQLGGEVNSQKKKTFRRNPLNSIY
jgi:hypothetical protein